MPTRAESAAVAFIRANGPMTIAAFMDLALYDPDAGYYATAPRRSGRAGDFFTNVDVGPLFGEMLAVQVAEIADLLCSAGILDFHIVEAGAGDGRLAKDLLDALQRERSDLYARARATLVERSAAARAAQAATLGAHASRVAPSADLPRGINGVIVANELLDALPVHSVVMTADGPREIYVSERGGQLVETPGPLSEPALAERLAAIALSPGQRADVSLEADAWIRHAAESLDAGVLLLFDYGHEAGDLYSAARASGTLIAHRLHTAGAVSHLAACGEADLTAQVDLTAIRASATSAGLRAVGAVDQTYFLASLGIADRLDAGQTRDALARRLAAKTLLMPGGLGSTMKVLAFAKGMDGVTLRGFKSGRLT